VKSNTYYFWGENFYFFPLFASYFI